MLKRTFLLLSVTFLLAPSPSRAGWFDEHWQYRRVLDVNWDADNGSGSELATADFYTAGHLAPSGADVRIVSEDGHVLPSHILIVGPGDRVRLVFALKPHQTKYYAYFGNPNPPAPPKGTEDVQFHCGLLMDMHTWIGGRANSPEEIADAFSRGEEVGQVMIDRPFYGLNPFGQPVQWVTRVSGSMAVPVDGNYIFAGGALSRGALYIDGNPALYIPGPANKVRFRTTLAIKRGRHDFALYDANLGGDGWFSLGWQRPDMNSIQVMTREPFGILDHAQSAQLEEYHKSPVADFSAEYLGEYQHDGGYSHRYRLTAHLPKLPGAKVRWDFGDGQISDQPIVEHIWVTAGAYPIHLTVSNAETSDTQTTQFSVDRDWQNLDHPADDDAQTQSAILANYHNASVPSDWLPWMAQIHEAAGDMNAALNVADLMASQARHDNPSNCLTEIKAISGDLLPVGKSDAVIAMLDRVPGNSDLQPQAARFEAQTLLWWVGDFAKAQKVLEPFASADDPELQRIRAESLVLTGNVDDARRILDKSPVEDRDRDHLAAISGALARTIEYRIDQRDWETGENEWDQWEARCPTVFLEGYSVLLRIKLMEANSNRIPAAARVAEAFAKSVPNSAYAPQLLDLASRLLQPIDPAKSAELRAYLKARYPEDPLSQ